MPASEASTRTAPASMPATALVAPSVGLRQIEHAQLDEAGPQTASMGHCRLAAGISWSSVRFLSAGTCPSRWLHHLHRILYQQTERYRRIALLDRKVPRDVHAEHRAVFEAAMARDVDLACRLEGGHIDRTLTVLGKVLTPAA